MEPSKSIFNRNAMKYYKKGFNVVPCEDKRAIEGAYWQGLQTNRQTPEYLNNLMWLCEHKANRETVGIGIIMNDSIGAIDIDVDCTTVMDMVRDLTPFIKIGAKGLTGFVRHPGLPSYRSSIFAAEFLSEGTLCIAPPSVHHIDDETGEIVLYRWDGDKTFNDIESYAELPMITLADWENINDYIEEKQVIRPKQIVVVGGVRQQGEAGRNVALHNRCCNYFDGYKEFPDSVDDKVIKNCADLLVTLDKQLFPGHEWFNDTEDNGKYKTPKEAALFMATRVWDRMSKSTTSGDGAKKVVAALKAEPVKSMEEEIMETEGDLTKLCPTHEDWEKLVPEDGILADLYEVYIKMAANPFAGFGLLQASTTLGAAMCNKYYVNNKYLGKETHPNLYAICIGPTGCGKNDVLRAAKVAFEAVPGASRMLQSEIASGAGLIKGLMRSPARTSFYIIDEIFDEFNNEGTAKKIMAQMLKLYSSMGARYSGKIAVSEQSKIPAIWSPGLCILGVSTPEGLKEIINDRTNAMGFPNRIIYAVWPEHIRSKSIFEIAMDVEEFDGEAKKLDIVDTTPHSRLVELLTNEVTIDTNYQLREGQVDLERPLRIIAHTPESAKVVQAFGEAGQRFINPIRLIEDLAVGEELKASIKGSDEAVEAIKRLAVRAPEHMWKLAHGAAYSDNRHGIVGPACLAEEHFQWAANYVENSLKGFISTMGGHINIGTIKGVDEAVEYLRSKINGSHQLTITRRGAAKYLAKRYQEGSVQKVIRDALNIIGPHMSRNPWRFKDDKY